MNLRTRRSPSSNRHLYANNHNSTFCHELPGFSLNPKGGRIPAGLGIFEISTGTADWCIEDTSWTKIKCKKHVTDECRRPQTGVDRTLADRLASTFD